MRTHRVRTIAVSLVATLVILTHALAVLPTEANAQCPTLTTEGATFGITNFNTVKAQMWYNDGIWWGVFSDNDTGIHIYSFPNNTVTQGAIIDAGITGIPDALWDGSNLFVMVWKSVSLATLYKFNYNSVTKTYPLVSGFPINIPLNGSSTAALVMEKDSTGKMWATYTGTQGGLSDGKVRVIWSTSADHKVWNTTGFELESGLTPNLLEISALTHFGGNKIGIAWSNQPAKEIGFRYHVDGDVETTWSTKELVDSGIGPRGLGPVSDDHLTMKSAPDGRVFLVAKDNDNDGTPAHATEGRIWLYIRTVAGAWGQKTNIQPDFSQLPTRPVLMLDTFNNRAYVIYHDESPSGSGRNFITHSPMDTPSFDFPCVFHQAASSNPTSSKQNVTPTTGLMSVASTGNTGSGELVFRGVVLPSDHPVPTISNISPTVKNVGDAAFTLTVNGSNYLADSEVRWNGTLRTTTFVNSTQLTASITAADLSTAGTAEVTVFNTAPGGGTSNIVNLTINNPSPILSSISPNTKTAGDAAFTLTANGSNFVSTSTVRINGADRPTTFVNSTQLTAQLTAADVQGSGTPQITVFTPSPGGGLSGAVTLTVVNPVPSITSISPNLKNVGDAAFTLTVNGTGFISGSVVRVNGVDHTTTFFSTTQLTAQITASDLQSAGTFAVTVFNPAPGGGLSNSNNLTVNNLTPTLFSISPNVKNAGDGAFTMTVNGQSFVSNSVVRFNGSDRSTTFVNSGQLTAQITAADVASQGLFPITVFNPAPGGGLSGAVNLTVNSGGNPVPTIGGLSPSSKVAGDAAFTLTVNGTGYIASSVVNWNGSPRTTTFVNSTQITAQIGASDVAAQGTVPVTVVNPGPGGGTSNSVNFTVSAPGGGGYESDVAPRPNGSNNGSITISDWVQSGRFSAGLDTPNAGSEFQRADSAPKSSFGNGAITVSDWVQAGRYAAGLDPVVAASGPSGPAAAAEELGVVINSENVAADRVVRAVGNPLNPGQAGTVTIQLDSLGNENALGFSITFDPAVLTYVSAVLGADGNGVTLNVNPNQVASGRLGLALAQSAGQSFAAGTRQLVVITFNVAPNANGSTTIGFGDQPIGREISDPDVNVLTAAYTPAQLNINSVDNPVPVITSVNPTTSTAGGSAFILTVNGSNFVNGAVVRWNGSNRTTTFVNAGQLTAQITAADILTAGNAAITVFNPAPGGGVSNSADFATNNPSPSTSGLSPSSANAGSGAFVLTVNGGNFVNGSIVRWNGADRTTTFVNSTQLTAQITAADIQAAGTISVTVFNPGPGGGTSSGINFSINPPLPEPATLQFSASSFNISEAGGSAVVTINRTGDTSGASTVDFHISDPMSLMPCNMVNGQAAQNCDYTITAGTLSFAAGETSKTFTIPIVEDSYVEGNESLHFNLENPSGASLGNVTNAAVNIVDNDTTAPNANVIDQAGVFVRQQYLDFLNREPDAGGLDYWTNQISSCGTDLACIHSRRIGVSGAFFVELEFQRTGSIVYRMYKASYGQRPTYVQFMPDRSQLIDGPQLPATTLEYANRFVLRPEFKTAYPDSMTPSEFVNKLYDSAVLMNNATQRQQEITELANGGKTRAQVLLDLIDISEFKDREYNPSFVLMEYFGYLRRDPDQGGYDFWLDIVNNREPNNYRSMICAFITSKEYQERFSSVVSRSNADCAQQ